MKYPNVELWGALKSGNLFDPERNRTYHLRTVDCGDLLLPSGELVACDPFAGLSRIGNLTVTVPKGKYPVVVTLADVSDADDEANIREAYVSLLIDQTAIETQRRIITPSPEATKVPPEMGDDGRFFGFPVDAGTACFVDNQAVSRCMPINEADWYNEIFDNTSPQCWFRRMDDPNHIGVGMANILLPMAKSGENIVIVHSGLGDGYYPLIGGYDQAGNLVRIHIDFFVLFNEPIS